MQARMNSPFRARGPDLPDAAVGLSGGVDGARGCRGPDGACFRAAGPGPPVVRSPAPRRHVPSYASDSSPGAKRARIICCPCPAYCTNATADTGEAEVPLQEIKQAGSFRVALCYPNLYFVGMSNLGLPQRLPDAQRASGRAVRAGLPARRRGPRGPGADGAAADHAWRAARELRSFHVLAFSVSFENDYLHVLRMLRLAGIPLRAEDRGPRDPIVILGGAAVFLNPEPLAPFADLIAVGEGEALVPRMMEALPGAAGRAPGHRRPDREGRLLRARAATRCATTTTAPSPATTGRAA